MEYIFLYVYATLFGMLNFMIWICLTKMKYLTTVDMIKFILICNSTYLILFGVINIFNLFLDGVT